MTVRVGCLFSGIGLLERGFAEEGCEVTFQVEIDPACRRVLARHHPGVQLYDDIRKVTYERLRADLGERADVDVLVGGWPCQDISLAGARAGLAGERSGLFFEFARLAAEITPRWLVAENVPGLLSSYSPVEPPPSELPAGRGDWEVDETHDLAVVVSTLAELGYVGAWRCLDAQYFGVPQRRRRIFFVCHLGVPFSAPAQVLFEPDSSIGNPAEGEEAGQDDAQAAGAGADAAGLGEGELVSALTSAHGGPDDNMAQAGHLVPQAIGVGSEVSGDVAGTLGSTGDGRGWNSDLDRMGALVVSEPVFVGSEFREDLARPLTAVEHGQRYDLETENLLVDPRPYDGPVYVVHNGQGDPNFEIDRSFALDTESPPAITEPVYVVHNGEDTLVSEDIAMTVMGGPKGMTQAVTFRKSQRAHDPDDGETWVEDEVANTLNGYENHNDRRTTHAVVAPVPIELRMATRTSGATGAGTPGTGFGDAGDPSYPVMASPPPAVQTELSVRRLTPLECERLQGAPDGWTEDQTDSVRYKQLGNAVAAPVSRWVARRLLAVHHAITT